MADHVIVPNTFHKGVFVITLGDEKIPAWSERFCAVDIVPSVYMLFMCACFQMNLWEGILSAVRHCCNRARILNSSNVYSRELSSPLYKAIRQTPSANTGFSKM